MKNIKIPKQLTQRGKKLDFATVFTDNTKRGALPEVSIHTAKITAIKNSFKGDPQKMGNIYRLSEFYAVHGIENHLIHNILAEL